MLTVESDQIIAINTIITLVIFDNLKADDVNMMTNYILGLFHQYLRRLLDLHQKTIIKPLLWEVIEFSREPSFVILPA